LKKANVILAFHAHEPLWDLPNELVALTDDPEIHYSVRGDNYVLKRAKEERDIYAHLIKTAEALDAPVALDITNELLVQLDWYVPEVFQNLAAAYKNGTIYPVYTHAHHTHAALLMPDEINDEIRLNSELLHGLMGIPRPRHPGVFPTEDSIDASHLSAYKDAGMEYIIFPHTNSRQAHLAIEGKGDVKYHAFLVGPDIVALPRHFPVSQHIWRPITRYKPEQVRNQGYILGKYAVFEEEYQNKSHISFPISWDEAVAEYTGILEKALTELPNNGLILYIQDLELMDFGDIALKIIEEAWKSILDRKKVRVAFITPDDYMDKLGDTATLSRVRFHQVSWAPEIRLVLRYDGHYTPLNAGQFKGIDLTETVFKTIPFVFWEPGRFLTTIFGSILDAFGMPRRCDVTATALHDTRYALPQFDIKDQMTIHFRLMKRACNWGWRPEEGRQKRPFMHGYRLVELLLKSDVRDIAFAASRYQHPGDAIYKGAERIMEYLIDTRVRYLNKGIEKPGIISDKKDKALLELDRAHSHRVIAAECIERALNVSHAVEQATSPDGKSNALRSLLQELKWYCREVFVATDHIQRAWGCMDDIPAMIEIMYEHLYEMYPPKFPAAFRELFPKEWKSRENPRLF
jgi:hypothetical protein